VLAGAAAGVLTSAMLARLMSSQLFDTPVSDLVWLLPIVLGGLFVAAAGAGAPALRRAASIDPLTAMRAE
jgi:ABC-type antimicrobial peptide transport system permease subunit